VFDIGSSKRIFVAAYKSGSSLNESRLKVLKWEERGELENG
jgi:hypothetical protein